MKGSTLAWTIMLLVAFSLCGCFTFLESFRGGRGGGGRGRGGMFGGFPQSRGRGRQSPFSNLFGIQIGTILGQVIGVFLVCVKKVVH